MTHKAYSGERITLAQLLEAHSGTSEEAVSDRGIYALLGKRTVGKYVPLFPKTDIAHYAAETGVGWPTDTISVESSPLSPSFKPAGVFEENKVIDLRDPSEVARVLPHPRALSRS